jgi:hypothetical protein
MPWVKFAAGDNYSAFKHFGWQVHIYGAAEDELERWCASRGMVLNVIPWKSTMQDAGLRENALYLTRPDTYVALAEPRQDIGALERYFSRNALLLGGAAFGHVDPIVASSV